MSVFIDGYEIDASLSESHVFESNITEYPVESGSVIADHVRLLPETVTIEGIVSNTPLAAMIRARAQFALVNGEAFSTPSDEALARLLKIREDKEVVTIETSLRVYENMLIQSLDIPRSAREGDALVFTAVFKRVVLVTNERTTIRVAVPKAAKKRDLGNRAAPEVETPPPDYLLADPTTDPRFIGANSGGRTLKAFGGS